MEGPIAHQGAVLGVGLLAVRGKVTGIAAKILAEFPVALPYTLFNPRITRTIYCPFGQSNRELPEIAGISPALHTAATGNQPTREREYGRRYGGSFACCHARCPACCHARSTWSNGGPRKSIDHRCET